MQFLFCRIRWVSNYRIWSKIDLQEYILYSLSSWLLSPSLIKYLVEEFTINVCIYIDTSINFAGTNNFTTGTTRLQNCSSLSLDFYFILVDDFNEQNKAYPFYLKCRTLDTFMSSVNILNLLYHFSLFTYTTAASSNIFFQINQHFWYSAFNFSQVSFSWHSSKCVFTYIYYCLVFVQLSMHFLKLCSYQSLTLYHLISFLKLHISYNQ